MLIFESCMTRNLQFLATSLLALRGVLSWQVNLYLLIKTSPMVLLANAMHLSIVMPDWPVLLLNLIAKVGNGPSMGFLIWSFSHSGLNTHGINIYEQLDIDCICWFRISGTLVLFPPLPLFFSLCRFGWENRPSWSIISSSWRTPARYSQHTRFSFINQLIFPCSSQLLIR